jgi:two-component system, chemotaxis family, protein-glutamate methylesterase/glutaminase
MLMDSIKVLIVDDALVIRKILSDAIEAETDMEVIGTASNGKLALQRLTHLKPDVITLDVEMPEMNGLETLAEVRKLYPKLPIIMFSTLTERGAKVTIEALTLGASDYVTKPANVGNVSQSKERVRTELVEKIRLLAKRPGRATPRATTATSTPSTVPPKSLPSCSASSTLSSKVDIVTIGVSTGGPNALGEVMKRFPKDFSVPVLIVQHMPPVFTRLLAERLDAQSELNVIEAEEGMVLEAGKAYIAPGDYHMELRGQDKKYKVHLTQGAPENSCRPAVDVLFRSAVEHVGAHVLGVILTGMGQDGLKGCEHYKKTGAQVIAQDEDTSVVWGMPGAVVSSGFADKVLPLDQITNEICARVKK